MPAIRRTKRPAFVAEWTLGKLAKWLRLAGFDTLYDTVPPDFRRLERYGRASGRLVLSRTGIVVDRLGPLRCLLIQYNAPIDQVRQVMRHFDLHREDLAPLSRCSNCNCLLRPVDQADIRVAVPDYILHRHERFMACDRCQRVFWPGTHSARIMALIDRWFEP